VYADASEKAIAAVAYLRTLDKDGNSVLGFVLGKAKVAPTNGHTIPHLELCAAVLAVGIAVCFRTITGAKNPRGSYILLTVDSIPCRVTDLLSSDNWKRNLSVLRSHINPRLRWSGLVLASRYKSFRFVARSLDGKADANL
jgi:hypothetical protein